MKKKIEMPQCSKLIWSRDTWHQYQCLKKSVIERGGKFYCKIHDPKYIKAKEKEREKRYDSERCKKCKYHFSYNWYSYCPLCGTKRIFGKQLKLK